MTDQSKDAEPARQTFQGTANDIKNALLPFVKQRPDWITYKVSARINLLIHALQKVLLPKRFGGNTTNTCCQKLSHISAGIRNMTNNSF